MPDIRCGVRSASQIPLPAGTDPSCVTELPLHNSVRGPGGYHRCRCVSTGAGDEMIL